MIKVNITDDHRIVVESLSKILNESCDDIKVERCFYDIESCLKGLKAEIPDVLLLDIQLPDGDGVEFCAKLKAKHPDMKVIMLTSFSESSIVKRSLGSGAKGYILKNVDINELIEGIRIVNDGKTYISKDIRATIDHTKESAIWLTNRERQILALLAEGLSTAEIAQKLSRDEETVRSHRKNIMLKLNAKNIAEAVRIGIEKRLIV